MAKSFDLQTHHFNKQGKVVRVNDYRLVVDENGKRFERPVGSGMWYAEDGSLIKDESAEVRAEAVRAKAEQDALDAKAAEEARLKLREEVKAELEAEAKAKGAHGPGRKN